MSQKKPETTLMRSLGGQTKSIMVFSKVAFTRDVLGRVVRDIK